MSIRSLTRIFCDKCNPDKLDGGSGATYRGVLTMAAHDANWPFDYGGWQRRGDKDWCPLCVKEEKEEADANNEAFRQSRTGRR